MMDAEKVALRTTTHVNIVNVVTDKPQRRETWLTKGILTVPI